MNPRQTKLLFSIIDQYIKKAAPIASKMLAKRGSLSVSSATIRNEMAALEEGGYLIQPHTSAGRIPTEKGFIFYLNSLKKDDIHLSAREKKELSEAAKEKELPEKKLAKILAELSGEAVILAFGPKDVYYTGLSNLFAKPEFRDQNLIYRISEVVDHLDEIIQEIFDKTFDEVQVLVGKKNPFSSSCSVILSKYRSRDRQDGLIAILGPMRMDYSKNIALVRYVKELIEKI